MESASVQLLGYPWRLGGITVQISYMEGRCHQNWVRSSFCKWKWKYVKNGFFHKSLCHRKFAAWNFFGDGDYRTAMDSAFRISIWKGGTKFFDRVLVAWSQSRATKYDPLAKLWGVQKSRYGHNFQNISSKMNQRLLIGYEPKLFQV